MMNSPKKKLMKHSDAKELVSFLDEFNSLSDAFIKILTNRVDTKKKKLHTLSVMITDMKIPTEDKRSTISIQAIDINDTRVLKKGNWGSNKQKMSWEDDVRRRNRGIIL